MLDDLDDVGVAREHFLRFDLLVHHLFGDGVSGILANHFQSVSFGCGFNDVDVTHSSLAYFAADFVLYSCDGELLL